MHTRLVRIMHARARSYILRCPICYECNTVLYFTYFINSK